MRKPKNPSSLFSSEVIKVGCVYYNLDHPLAVQEMNEANNVWRYKLALEEMISDTRKYLEERLGKKLTSDIIDELLKKLVDGMKERLDGLDIE